MCRRCGKTGAACLAHPKVSDLAGAEKSALNLAPGLGRQRTASGRTHESIARHAPCSGKEERTIMQMFPLIVMGCGVLAGVALWRLAAIGYWSRRGVSLERMAIEDSLKHIHAQEVRGHLATRESVAGAVGIPLSEAMRHIVSLGQRGLIRHADSGIELTDEGRVLALQIIRAHRLLERYFADELRMPVDALHAAADRDEHRLSPADAAALEARLGYPKRDPHGDPIPTASGSVAASEETPLHQWPTGVPADIVHLEDEPPEVFQEIAKVGLKVGQRIEILDRSAQQITVWDGVKDSVISAGAADNVFVRTAGRPRVIAAHLSELKPGESATVRDLDCEGFTRRRLLDLGVTPGTRVDCLFAGMAPEPLAYRIRGAVIALRRNQADDIVIERAAHSTDHPAPAVADSVAGA